ncbi:MAG: glycosyltransferase, partial [Pseudomonadota bacterium]|nr:glycosyltransferase [Pseudomonadota bacterium]
MKLSVVVPTLDAGRTLGRCLDRLRAADEIVVADGGSSDATAAVAESAGARVVRAPKGRGTQLRAGAAAAEEVAAACGLAPAPPVRLLTALAKLGVLVPCPPDRFRPLV